MMKKQIISIALTVAMLFTALPFNFSFAASNGVMQEPTHRKLHLHAQGETLKETEASNVSTVPVGETFNLYFSIDNPNKGAYDDTVDTTAVVNQAKIDEEAFMQADAEALLLAEAKSVATSENFVTDSPEWNARVQEYYDDNHDTFVNNYKTQNRENRLKIAERRAKQKEYHSTSRYDLNGYTIKIYYKKADLVPQNVDGVTTSDNIIDYTIPDNYLADGELGLNYYVHEKGVGDVQGSPGWAYAYATVFFEGDFLPQEEISENFFNLCAIPFKADSTGTTQVYCELDRINDYGIELFAKRENTDGFQPAFSYDIEYGGYHIINIQDQTKPLPPVAAPDSKTDTESFDVTLTCATPDCTIYYSTDGGVTSTEYTVPITVNSSVDITCWSVKNNDTAAVSNRVTYEYRIVPEKPLLFEKTGDTTYELILNAKYEVDDYTVYCENNAVYDGVFDNFVEIYYTFTDIEVSEFDGTSVEPDEGWSLLDKASGQTISVTENNTVRLIAVRPGNKGDEISGVSVYVLGKRPAPVTATPQSGEALNGVTLETSTTDAEIYFTTDGSDPRENGTKYTGEAVTFEKATVIRAVAKKDGIFSEVNSFWYEVSSEADDGITANAPAGEYAGSVQIELTPNNSDYKVQYRIDGNWQDYDGYIEITQDTTVSARVVDNAGNQVGTVSEFEYSIIPLSPVFAPKSTTFTSTDTVTVYAPETTKENTSDYKLYYTLDGSNPKTNGILAPDATDTAVVTVSERTVIKAVVKKGDKYSEVITQVYNVISTRPAQPLVTLEPGNYTKKIDGAEITTQFMPESNDVEIYYTISTDAHVIDPDISEYNENPSTSLTKKYTPNDEIELNARTVIKAIAYNKETGTQSEVAVFKYVVTPESPTAEPVRQSATLPVVRVDIESGSVVTYEVNGVEGTITDTDGIDEIFIDTATGKAYDASNPTTEIGTTIGTPVSTTEATLVINAELDGIESEENVYEYVTSASNKLSAPYADKNSGVYYETNSGFSVTLLSPNDGDTIKYRKDGATDWTEYDGNPISLSADTVIYAYSEKAGYENSEIVSYSYEFVPLAPIISKSSGRYNAPQTVQIKLDPNAPSGGNYTLWYCDNTDGDYSNPVGNFAERTINESQSFYAYVVNNDTGKVSECVIRYYTIEDELSVAGDIYSSLYTVNVYGGETVDISGHLLNEDGYRDGIKLHSQRSGLNVRYYYEIKYQNGTVLTSDVTSYLGIPIIVNDTIKEIKITAWHTDPVDNSVVGNTYQFKYKFTNIPVPVTDLYASNPLKTEYTFNTQVKFNDVTSGQTLVLYYTLDGSDPVVSNSTREIYDGVDDDIYITSNPTVIKAVYYKPCGNCPHCALTDYHKCTDGVYGEARTFRYTIPTVTGGASSGSGGGGGSVSKTPQYTKDIFGNEHTTHISYINGYPDGSVRPEGKITREEMASILYRIKNRNYDEPFASTGEVFPDVEHDRWSVVEIEYMADKGIIEGYPDGEFKPAQSLTRAEFASLIYRLVGLDNPTAENPFLDIDSEHWAYEAVIALYEAELIQGYEDRTIRPDNEITRAEVMTVVNKILGRKPLESYVKSLDFKPFNDLDENAWYYVAVLEATITHDYTLNKDGYEYKWEIKKNY